MPRVDYAFTPLAKQTLTAAGTRQKVTASSLKTGRVMIQAAHGNTGVIYIGDVTVDATHCVELAKGEVLLINAEQNDNEIIAEIDISTIYFDGDTNSDKILVAYLPEISHSYT